MNRWGKIAIILLLTAAWAAAAYLGVQALHAQQNVQQAQEKLAQKEQQITALKEAAAEQQSELDALNAAITARDISIDQLTDELTQSRAQAQSQMEQMVQLQEDAAAAKIHADSAAQALETAQVEANGLRVENARQTEKMTALQSELDTAKQQLAEQQTLRATAEAQRDQAQAAMEQANRANQDALAALQTALQEKESEIAQLNLNNTSLAQAWQDAERIFEQFADMVDGWQQSAGNNALLQGMLAPFTDFVAAMRAAINK